MATYPPKATNPTNMANPPTWTYSPTLQQLYDLVVTHGLSQVHGNMTGNGLDQIVSLIHQRVIRKNHNMAHHIYKFILDRHVWRYCFMKDMTFTMELFTMEHPQYLFPGVGPTQQLQDEQYAARRVALLQSANAPAPA
ncbi:hypothetical protein OCU04_010754 [Sclerotinia nivalis]|uniref:Uncharacterized protein n=1 Tax=Sclerotinia nivalis TaxID=352851 RepID=A0A9X0ACV8_9HELO|nr:hypothetical protein OCU04_010754 [Sclerotinia nivalis]